MPVILPEQPHAAWLGVMDRRPTEGIDDASKAVTRNEFSHRFDRWPEIDRLIYFSVSKRFKMLSEPRLVLPVGHPMPQPGILVNVGTPARKELTRSGLKALRTFHNFVLTDG